jgi:hypothetical protein
MQNHWLRPFAHYVGWMLAGNLAWEIAQLPLYTIWREGTAGQIVFAVLHCTAGDGLIAASALALAWFLAGRPRWPSQGYGRVAIIAIAAALTYTVFSEWLNVSVRGAWAYADAMPKLPPFGTGLAPLLQWLVVPGITFWWLRRAGD